MSKNDFDIVIVGAGMAGAGLAAALGPGFRIAILEQEDRPGYHSTGRSAAVFIRNYGNGPIRALTAASAPLFDELSTQSPSGPLLTPRGLLYVADQHALAEYEALLAESDGLERIDVAAAIGMVPSLRPDWLAAAAYEHDTQDIDVAALHELFLRRARAAGSAVMASARLSRAQRIGSTWHIETALGSLRAGIIVNAAGAWADAVAAACGVAPIGLVPHRRSMAVVPVPDGLDVANWPLVADVAERWYFKADAGRLFVSPADEDPVEPHDAFADDMVLAEGLHRFEQAVAIPVTRVERSWAGLRTFATDRTPVAGYDRTAEGFFWLAGHGGYGIQTAPGLSALAANLIRREPPPAVLEPIVDALSPDRFRRDQAGPSEKDFSMTIRRLHVGPRMSQAVIHNDTVYLAGQVGEPGKSVTEQTRAVLASIDKLLAEAGTSKSKILSATIWLADMGKFAEMNAVWDAWVDPQNTPARATGESALATPDYHVEIIVVAAL